MKEEKQGPQRNKWRRRVWRYGPLLGWLAFIYFASTNSFSASNTSRILGPILRWLMPGAGDVSITYWHGMIRKAAHFTEYGLLAWLAARTFVTSSKELLRRHWFGCAAILVALYALFDEYHQSFVSTRTGSIYDSMIDMAGGLTVLLGCLWWSKRGV